MNLLYFVCLGVWLQYCYGKLCDSVTCNLQNTRLSESQLLQYLPFIAAERANLPFSTSDAPYGITFAPAHHTIPLLIVKGRYKEFQTENWIYNEAMSKIQQEMIVQVQLIDVLVTKPVVQSLSQLYVNFNNTIQIVSFNDCEFERSSVDCGFPLFSAGLQYVSIIDCVYNSAILSKITRQLPHKLAYLNVSKTYSEQSIVFSNIKWLANLTELSSITLENIKFFDGQKRTFCNVLIGLSKLNKVSLNYCNIASELFKAICSHVGWGILDISHDLTIERIDFGAFRKMPNLYHLNISGASCDSDVLKEFQDTIINELPQLRHLIWKSGTYPADEWKSLLDACLFRLNRYILFEIPVNSINQLLSKQLGFIQFLDSKNSCWREPFILKTLNPFCRKYPDVYLAHLTKITVEMSLNDTNLDDFFNFLMLFENLKKIDIIIPSFNVTSMEKYFFIAGKIETFVSLQSVRITIGEFKNQLIGSCYLYLLIKIVQNTKELTIDLAGLLPKEKREKKELIGWDKKDKKLANWMKTVILVLEAKNLHFSSLHSFFLIYPLDFYELGDTLRWLSNQPRIRYFGFSISDSLVENLPDGGETFDDLFFDISTLNMFHLILTVYNDGKYFEPFLRTFCSHFSADKLTIELKMEAKCDYLHLINSMTSLKEFMADGKISTSEKLKIIAHYHSEKTNLLNCYVPPLNAAYFESSADWFECDGISIKVFKVPKKLLK